MKKTITSLLAITFALSITGAAFGASGKCTVVAVDDKQITLDCGGSTEDFPVGTAVKIKSERKKAIEGC